MTPATPDIFISLGDPLGIGTEVTLKALKHFKDSPATFHLVGHSLHFELTPTLQNVLQQHNVRFVEVTAVLKDDKEWNAGHLSLLALQECLRLLQNPKTQALVTAPIAKKHIQKAGCPFPGHTELLSHHYGIREFAMMLFAQNLRIVLLSVHKPLREVFADVNAINILSKLKLMQASLQTQFGIAKPRIAVCGLNPHASENGLFGDEEANIIAPALAAFQNSPLGQNTIITGPLAADTIFHKALHNEFDAVLCHYHDQGLIPIKTLYFDEAVNMTLGLPIIRTSPDHGTAFDIAGRMVASEKSMINALQAALNLLGKQL